MSMLYEVQGLIDHCPQASCRKRGEPHTGWRGQYQVDTADQAREAMELMLDDERWDDVRIVPPSDRRPQRTQTSTSQVGTIKRKRRKAKR